MRNQEQLTMKSKRLSGPKPRFKPYSGPPYRLTLIAESSGLAPTRFEGLDREQFLVCGLDAKHRIIGINIVSIGSLTLAIVHQREVLMNAAACICAPQPSVQ